jgi:cbb3-type cytochrome oxidase maturation protein
MSDNIIALMLTISTALGAFGLFALIWGLKTGQFNDHNKFINGAKFDSEEDYQDAVMMEQKKKEALERKKKEREKNYMPED